ncbi:MAG: dephospho-CoA kinase [Mangrovibacterium sp.]
MIKLGVTGGIGSGKSTICKIFASLGIPIYEADNRAKQVMDNSASIRQKLIDTFGADIYSSTDVLDRKKLASTVFSSPERLQQLNNIVHPEVRKDFLLWTEQQTHAPYVIQEAAILFESGLNLIMDKSLTVNAPIEERITRVMKRDCATKQQVLDRINNQMTDDQRLALADFAISNSASDIVSTQVFKIDQILRHG